MWTAVFLKLLEVTNRLVQIVKERLFEFTIDVRRRNKHDFAALIERPTDRNRATIFFSVSESGDGDEQINYSEHVESL